jgi:hypothetical protein
LRLKSRDARISCSGLAESWRGDEKELSIATGGGYKKETAERDLSTSIKTLSYPYAWRDIDMCM